MKRTIALLAPCLFAACAQAQPPGPAPARAPHVVIVTIDGLRPDAISEARTPALARLLREGAASRASRVPKPSLTLPGHLSMVTGQTAARHGVWTNNELAQEPGGATLFTVAHAAGLRTGLYVGKVKLRALAPRASADVVAGPEPGDAWWERGAVGTLAARFAADYPRERYALAFVHLREPDEAAHDFGWMSPEYRAALAESDRALAVVRRAIKDSGLPATLILTSDHGGTGKQHWSDDPLDAIVPWACAGPGVKPGTALEDPRLIDVGPTAAALLGVTLPEAEGRVVNECGVTAAR